jgi:hypothetical protein
MLTLSYKVIKGSGGLMSSTNNHPFSVMGNGGVLYNSAALVSQYDNRVLASLINSLHESVSTEAGIIKCYLVAAQAAAEKNEEASENEAQGNLIGAIVDFCALGLAVGGIGLSRNPALESQMQDLQLFKTALRSPAEVDLAIASDPIAAAQDPFDACAQAAQAQRDVQIRLGEWASGDHSSLQNFAKDPLNQTAAAHLAAEAGSPRFVKIETEIDAYEASLSESLDANVAYIKTFQGLVNVVAGNGGQGGTAQSLASGIEGYAQADNKEEADMDSAEESFLQSIAQRYYNDAENANEQLRDQCIVGALINAGMPLQVSPV